ncbi:hypothetical protein [Nannocystis punicea]|uniref:Membrane protein 6-pyruvoyl-tetrahydropterin synthase-related domain-containing protein n=1 Tax=Nannocystis punicea TaxID=2995304 RepID=A0ABY7HBU5_9BACT|nr:hypothetical protein [Nannocystis poenicansa]WAS96474.1 hypothetical protein O0S08_09970 [Nannocystis poenicansa]
MTDTSARAESTRWAWLRGHRGMFVGFAAVHAGLVLNSIPLRVVFGALPFGGPDYQTHFQHTHTLTRALAEGRSWVYDPMMLAGYPAGLFFDVDNKAHFLWCTVLHQLGVPLATAFNLYTLASAIAMPISLWLAARLLGVPVRAQAWTFGLGVLLWHFESLIRFFWGGGMISFATASHLCVLVLALFWRQLSGAPVRGGWAALLVLLPLALLTHVWSFAALAGPMIGLYLARARGLGLLGHARVWGLAAVTVVVNAYWLWPALTHMELMAPSHKLGQATPDFFLYDLLEVFVDPLTTGFVRQRTLVRTIAVLAAIGTLVAWRRTREPALRYALGTALWLFGLSYVGALLPLVPATEPYRFAAPMACWAAVLAGPWLADNLTRKTWSQVPASLRGLAIGLLVLLAPRVYAQLATFLPGVDVSPMGFLQSAVLEEQFFPSMRLKPISGDFQEVAAWVAAQPDDGRVLVHYWALGEYLRWATDRPILGGFPDRRTIHEQANLFHWTDSDERYNEGLERYLQTFNVAYVLMSVPHIPAIERRLDLLEPRGIVGGRYRAYRVRKPTGYFVRGRGEVKAGLGRIAVSAASPAPGTQELVLRFHWLQELTCKSAVPNVDCRIEREPVEGDETGFLRVVGAPTLPAEFVLEQGR